MPTFYVCLFCLPFVCIAWAALWGRSLAADVGIGSRAVYHESQFSHYYHARCRCIAGKYTFLGGFMRYTSLIFLGLFFCGCASMPPSVKIIEQVTKNEDAIEEIEESDLPAPVKARAVSAIQNTQKLAV